MNEPNEALRRGQPVRVGRRLAAIVAADVAGYSRLMGLDEVGTARTTPRTPQGYRCTRREAWWTPCGRARGDGVLREFPSRWMIAVE
jgi:hypothetical protein